MGNLATPSPKQSSTPICYRTTLALKLFRGEPAISRFDWHFTANHRSSGCFAAHYGSVLHVLLHTLQPAHGYVTWFRVYSLLLGRPIQPRFHYAYDKCLKLAVVNNSLDRSTKSTLSHHKGAPTPCTHTISGSISLPFRGSFNLSLTVLVHYRS